MDKCNVVYAYNGILFGNKEVWSTNRHYDIGRSQKHYAK